MEGLTRKEERGKGDIERGKIGRKRRIIRREKGKKEDAGKERERRKGRKSELAKKRGEQRLMYQNKKRRKKEYARGSGGRAY